MAIAVLGKLRSFIGECRRVLTVTKKPSKDELMAIVKVAGIGIALIGFLGFILQLLSKLVFQG
jgi:protein transport protein SEC61 subunit gamma and related proteins